MKKFFLIHEGQLCTAHRGRDGELRDLRPVTVRREAHRDTSHHCAAYVRYMEVPKGQEDLVGKDLPFEELRTLASETNSDEGRIIRHFDVVATVTLEDGNPYELFRGVTTVDCGWTLEFLERNRLEVEEERKRRLDAEVEARQRALGLLGISDYNVASWEVFRGSHRLLAVRPALAVLVSFARPTKGQLGQMTSPKAHRARAAVDEYLREVLVAVEAAVSGKPALQILTDLQPAAFAEALRQAL